MKRLILWLFALLGSYSAISQITFISTSNGGAWNVGTTWDQTACTSGCVEGQDYPGPGDVAIVAVAAGKWVTFPRGMSPSFSCKDLYVVSDVASSLGTTGITGSPTLTIHGQISGALSDFSALVPPTVNVFHTSMTSLGIIFTGSNLDDPFSGSVITSWGHISPFYRITLNPGSGNTLRVDSHSIRNSSVLQSGTVQINSGEIIQDATGSAQFIINASSVASVLGVINGNGTGSSRFGTVTVNGTLTTGTSAYVNAINFNLGASSTLNVGFSGADQTQGWWYQSSLPTSAVINSTSSVNYSASAAQNIYATTYGNLSLSSLSAVTKTLSGTGVTIQGNLSVGNNVSFSPASQVDFTGSTGQAISGGGTLNFAGGLEINKSSGTLTVSKALTTNGITITAGSLDLGNVNTTLSGGNVINSGTITSGSSGTLTVAGTTTVSGSGSLNLNHLTVTGSATFNNSAFTITGNVANNGTLAVSATSTLTFSGGINQTISGGAFSLGNMVVNKTSSTLSNDGNVQLLGVLTLTTGTFDADGSGAGNFTLNSDTNGDAAVGPMAGGSITGEVTFERYFSNSSNRWRNIGFPVTSVTFAELGSSITLSSGSLATYTESTLGNADQGWNTVSSGTLNSRLGHSAYMYNTGPITISVKGPLLQNVPSTSGSPYNFAVTYTDDPAQPSTDDGWNFVSNPYASPINWSASSGWTKINVNAAAAVWDAQNGAYQYSNVAWDGTIAQGQSFWVQTNNSSPTLTSTESVKVSNSDPVFFRMHSAETVESRLLITLSDAKSADKALIQFRKGATEEFDSQFDATKLNNLIFNLSSLSPSGLKLAANVLPRTGCSSSIKLNLTNIIPGSYDLKFEGITSFSDAGFVVLVDHFKNSSKIVKEGEIVSFSVDENPQSFGSQRFELKFSFTDSSVKTPEITVDNRKLVSSYASGNQWFYNGKAIVGATEKSLTATKIGTYQLEVNVNGCTVLSAPVEIFPGSSRVFPNPAQQQMTVDVSGLEASSGHIYIFTLSGEVILKDVYAESDKSKDILVSDIKPGIYLLKVISKSEGVLMEERIVIRR